MRSMAVCGAASSRPFLVLLTMLLSRERSEDHRVFQGKVHAPEVDRTVNVVQASWKRLQ